MNRIACIYFEGNDSKVALFSKEKDKLFIHKAESLDISLSFSETRVENAVKSNGNGKQKEMLSYDFVSEKSTNLNGNYVQKLNGLFLGETIQKYEFIPVLGEPAIYFQKVENNNGKSNSDHKSNGKSEVTTGYLKLFDGSTLAVYPSGKSNYLQILDSLAKSNDKKFLKIPSVKSAEISLATYISRKNKFRTTDSSLVLYVGKEYSKLIFLRGNKIHQISPTLSVGKNSFNAHNVIVSKILLEMEHAGFSKLDKIIVCGEDESKEFISTIMEAYPQSKVGTVTFDDVEVISKDSFSSLSSFIIPIAVAEEYFNEADNNYTGINLLPDYIKDEQKPFQLGWQSYIIMVLIFVTAVFLTFQIVSNKNKISNKREEIRLLHRMQEKNRATVEKIKDYRSRIKNVDQTKVILNRLSVGTGVFSNSIKKLADFTGSKKNLWISNLKLDQNKDLQISGYTLSRHTVKVLSDTYDKSRLQNIIYDPMRNYRAFKFLINTGGKINAAGGKTKK